MTCACFASAQETKRKIETFLHTNKFMIKFENVTFSVGRGESKNVV